MWKNSTLFLNLPLILNVKLKNCELECLESTNLYKTDHIHLLVNWYEFFHCWYAAGVITCMFSSSLEYLYLYLDISSFSNELRLRCKKDATRIPYNRMCNCRAFLCSDMLVEFKLEIIHDQGSTESIWFDWMTVWPRFNLIFLFVCLARL